MIPYNKNLVKNAQTLRKNMTPFCLLQRAIPLRGEMSQSDKRVAVLQGKGDRFAVDEVTK